MSTAIEQRAPLPPPEVTSPAASVVAPAVQVGNHRFLFVDGLRGVAASLVVYLHFYFQGPESIRENLARLVPFETGWLVWVYNHCFSGVDIFFVISGFVIAHSVGSSRVTPRYFANFALRRSMRLDPPYLVALATSIVVLVLSNLVLKSRQLPMPSVGEVLANMFYLHMFLGYHDMIEVSWTLVHEIQFYLLFILLTGCVQRLSRVRWVGTSWAYLLVFGVTGAASLLWPAPGPRHLTALCIKTWFLFCMGVFCYLGVKRVVSGLAAVAFLVPVSAYMAYHADGEGLTAPLTVAALVAAAATGNLTRWLDQSVFQYLGRISYPLYLIHIPVGSKVLNLASRYKTHSIMWALLASAAAWAVSLLAADLLHRFVEAPSIRFAKRFRKAT